MLKLSNACSVTCKDFPKDIPPYSDIGGIGVRLGLPIIMVFLAFLITAWLVVVVLIVYYLKAFDPSLDPFREENTQQLCKYPNAVDYSIHKMLRKVPGFGKTLTPGLARSSKLKAVLDDCVLMFADIQIFTGLSILISAFVSLGCDIVAYHWQYMIYLAWLASVTHLASLSFLRNHLARNRVKCIWRLTAMAIIQVLLSVAVGLSTTFGSDPWLVEEGGRPAICYFKERPDTKSVAFQSAIKMIILLIWALFIRIFKMFEGFEGGLRRIASKLYQKSREQQYGAGGTTADEWDPSSHILHSSSLMKYFWIALLAILSIQIDLVTSFLAEVYWLLFSIIWITIRLNKFRELGPQDDSKWSFGQVLPLILLVAPLATALENFYTKPTNNVSETPSTLDHNITTNRPGHIGVLHHIDTTAYRGAFLLSSLSYLEIGVYFILIQEASDGIIAPLAQISLVLILLNTLLQFMWVIFGLWVCQVSWGVTLKRACYDTVLQSFVAISLTTNFAALISDAFFESFGTRSVFNTFAPISCVSVCFLFGYYYFLVLHLITKFGNAKWGFIASLILLCGSFLVIRTYISSHYGYEFNNTLDIYWMSIYTVGFMLLLLINYGLQVWAERKHFSNWLVSCLRCLLMVCVNALIMYFPGLVLPIPGALVFSFHLCISIFLGFRLVSQRRQSSE